MEPSNDDEIFWGPITEREKAIAEKIRLLEERRRCMTKTNWFAADIVQDHQVSLEDINRSEGCKQVNNEEKQTVEHEVTVDMDSPDMCNFSDEFQCEKSIEFVVLATENLLNRTMDCVQETSEECSPYKCDNMENIKTSPHIKVPITSMKVSSSYGLDIPVGSPTNLINRTGEQYDSIIELSESDCVQETSEECSPYKCDNMENNIKTSPHTKVAITSMKVSSSYGLDIPVGSPTNLINRTGEQYDSIIELSDNCVQETSEECSPYKCDNMENNIKTSPHTKVAITSMKVSSSYGLDIPVGSPTNLINRTGEQYDSIIELSESDCVQETSEECSPYKCDNMQNNSKTSSHTKVAITSMKVSSSYGLDIPVGSPTNPINKTGEQYDSIIELSESDCVRETSEECSPYKCDNTEKVIKPSPHTKVTTNSMKVSSPYGLDIPVGSPTNRINRTGEQCDSIMELSESDCVRETSEECSPYKCDNTEKVIKPSPHTKVTTNSMKVSSPYGLDIPVGSPTNRINRTGEQCDSIMELSESDCVRETSEECSPYKCDNAEKVIIPSRHTKVTTTSMKVSSPYGLDIPVGSPNPINKTGERYYSIIELSESDCVQETSEECSPYKCDSMENNITQSPHAKVATTSMKVSSPYGLDIPLVSPTNPINRTGEQPDSIMVLSESDICNLDVSISNLDISNETHLLDGSLYKSGVSYSPNDTLEEVDFLLSLQSAREKRLTSSNIERSNESKEDLHSASLVSNGSKEESDSPSVAQNRNQPSCRNQVPECTFPSTLQIPEASESNKLGPPLLEDIGRQKSDCPKGTVFKTPKSAAPTPVLKSRIPIVESPIHKYIHNEPYVPLVRSIKVNSSQPGTFPSAKLGNQKPPLLSNVVKRIEGKVVPRSSTERFNSPFKKPPALSPKVLPAVSYSGCPAISLTREGRVNISTVHSNAKLKKEDKLPKITKHKGHVVLTEGSRVSILATRPAKHTDTLENSI